MLVPLASAHRNRPGRSGWEGQKPNLAIVNVKLNNFFFHFNISFFEIWFLYYLHLKIFVFRLEFKCIFELVAEKITRKKWKKLLGVEPATTLGYPKSFIMWNTCEWFPIIVEGQKGKNYTHRNKENENLIAWNPISLYIITGVEQPCHTMWK